jgi:hypothetical protein
MPDAKRFSFTAGNNTLSESGLMPYLPITLHYQNNSIATLGLLDTGASVNVLPYHLGIELGAVWNQEAATLKLSGNLASLSASPLFVFAVVGQFKSVRLAFAWTQTDEVPLILGQINFFMEFDVCFYRSQQAFEVKAKS